MLPLTPQVQTGFLLCFCLVKRESYHCIVLCDSPGTSPGQVFFYICIPGASTAFQTQWESERGPIQAKRKHFLQVFKSVCNFISTWVRSELKLNKLRLDMRRSHLMKPVTERNLSLTYTWSLNAYEKETTLFY